MNNLHAGLRVKVGNNIVLEAVFVLLKANLSDAQLALNRDDVVVKCVSEDTTSSALFSIFQGMKLSFKGFMLFKKMIF